MAQRMGLLSEWQRLGEDAGLSLPGKERTVALEVNSASPVGVYATGANDSGPEVLVGLVEGRDRLEFTVSGDVELYVTGGELFYKTMDGQVVVNIADPADPILTRIANRRVRNFNLEMMEFQMKRNLERRMEQMMRDAEQRLGDTERVYAASRYPDPALVEAALRKRAQEGDSGEGSQPSQAPAGKVGADEAKGGAGGKPAKSGKPAPATGDD